MTEKNNAGYSIIEEISLRGNNYVMGHNPNAPSPYVTWAYVEDRDYYTFGHYFSNKTDACADMIKRAMECLPAHEHDALIRGAMREELISEIMEEGRMENRLSDIDSCLRDALHHLDIDESRAEAIMADEDFIQYALGRYHSIDHSYENEALADSLEALLKERFPQHLMAEQNQTSSLDDLIQSAEEQKISVSGRELEIIKKALDMTGDRIADSEGYSSGQEYWNLKEKLAGHHGTSKQQEIDR